MYLYCYRPKENDMTNDDISKKIGEILIKCWEDENHKQKLLADANAVLEKEGIPIPVGVSIKVLENTATIKHYVLPSAPKKELSDADLDTVAGGSCLFDGHKCTYDDGSWCCIVDTNECCVDSTCVLLDI